MYVHLTKFANLNEAPLKQAGTDWPGGSVYPQSCRFFVNLKRFCLFDVLMLIEKVGRN